LLIHLDVYCRGAQSMGDRLSWQLTFVQWQQIFVGLQYGTSVMSPLCQLEFRGRLCLKCDGTRAETRFHLSAKWTSPFKSAGGISLTTAGRGVRMSGSNAGYTMFRGSAKGTGYPLHLPVPPSFPLPCVTTCHHISNGL
jgi:hypothetical protein